MHIAWECVIINSIELFLKEADVLETLQKELRFATVGTLILDGIVWLCSLPFAGIGIPVPLGLLLGSAGMLLNLLLLRRSIHNAVYHGKTRDFGGYLLRCLVASAVIACGMCIHWINALAAILPFLYPKILFGVLAFREGRRKN